MKEFVYILPNATGGVASVVSNLIRYTGHPEIHKKVILTGNSEKPCNVNFYDAEVIVESAPKKWVESRRKFVRRIARHLTHESIIISNDGNPEFSMIEMLHLTNPVIAILHGDNNHYFNGCKRYSYLIDRIICVSSYLQQKAIQQIGQGVHPIFVPFPIPKIESLKDKSNNGPIKLVYSGGITEAKGCEHFPALIDLLDTAGVDYEFHIIGNGDLLDSLINRYANHSRIKIYGYQPNKAVLDILKKMHIAILFSKFEGLPVCVVEAMKSGAVPIVFDLPTGIPDIIQDGINGYRVSQGDVTSVVRYIKALSVDSNRLDVMSKSAIETANNLFNPYHQTKCYEDIFLATISDKAKYSQFCPSLKTKIISYIPYALAEKMIYGIHR